MHRDQRVASESEQETSGPGLSSWRPTRHVQGLSEGTWVGNWYSAWDRLWSGHGEGPKGMLLAGLSQLQVAETLMNEHIGLTLG